MKLCPQCEKENPSSANHCMYCGTALVEEEQLSEEAKLLKKLKGQEEENRLLKTALDAQLKQKKPQPAPVVETVAPPQSQTVVLDPPKPNLKHWYLLGGIAVALLLFFLAKNISTSPPVETLHLTEIPFTNSIVPIVEEQTIENPDTWIEEYNQFMETAQAYYNNKDYVSALVEYKNAEKKIPSTDQSNKRSTIEQKIADCTNALKETEQPAQMQAVVMQSTPQEANSVVINGVRWAICNVGEKGKFVSSPEEYGNLYDWDEAQTVCPKDWRLPTDKELQSVIDAGSEWTTVNGVAGRQFGRGKNSIFLPAAGLRNYSNGADDRGTIGLYWSKRMNNTYGAYGMTFDSSSGGIYNDVRSYGFSVRCVSE
jgi:uncharacterized protein (TIGR02145 family)